MTTALRYDPSDRSGRPARDATAPWAGAAGAPCRVSDRVEIADLQPNEEAVICELADEHAVMR